MPYLHWETDRRRSKFNEIMRNITEEHKNREWKIKRSFQCPLAAGADSNSGKLRTIKTISELMDTEFRHQVDSHPDSKFARTKVAKRFISGGLTPKTALGQVLYRAALLHEAMEYYQEQELLKEYLHHNPPLHPRRTLDQSYYWTLKTTENRDRDQVVYRGTAPKKEFQHDGGHVKSGCEQCFIDIRKVPRVVMVDQLWLWILNGSTSPYLLIEALLPSNARD
jgi:hypothetical protein